MTDNRSDDTKPDLQVAPTTTGIPPTLDVEIGARTHTGRVRTNNEDNFHIVRFGRFLRTVLSSLPEGEAPEEDSTPGYGFALADGMGGHKAGEVASRAALTTLVEVSLQTPDWILGSNEEHLSRVMDRTLRRFQQVNSVVRDQSQGQSSLREMGTTLALAITFGDAMIVAHVGDSRAYLFREGALHRLTQDHTVGQRLADLNMPMAARFRHVLTRCIGGCDPVCEPDVAQYRLQDGDRLLLCSDGLTDMVDDESIARELGRPASSDTVCRELVELALDAGGRDNVTVIVATFRSAGPPA
jgi:protein phosphatase